MRAKTINEINFERTGDSLDKLQLGQGQIIKYKLFNELSKMWEPKYIEDLSDNDDWIYFKIKPGEIDHYISFYNGTFQIGSKENGWDEKFGIRRSKKNIDEVLQKAISALDDKTKYNQFRKKVLENFNFERIGDPLDKIQIGRIKERKLKKKGEEIEPYLKKVMEEKTCSKIKTIINLESNIIQKSFIFYDKINKLEPIFYISYYDLNSLGFSVGFYLQVEKNDPYKGDEIEYDSLEDCVNKLEYWIKNYKNYL
jgi:hypothetical protein